MNVQIIRLNRQPNRSKLYKPNNSGFKILFFKFTEESNLISKFLYFIYVYNQCYTSHIFVVV